MNRPRIGRESVRIRPRIRANPPRIGREAAANPPRIPANPAKRPRIPRIPAPPGGSKIRCGVHSLSEKFRFSPYLVRYLCPGGEAGDSKQLAFRSSPSLGGDELDMPRLLACGGRPVTARTDEDTGEPAPARSLPHTQTRARGARQPPPHQPSCFAPQVRGSSFR